MKHFSSKPTIDGGFIIGGMSVSPISGDKTEGKVGAIFYDYWIVKVDSNGVVEWDNTIGGNNNDYLMSIDATSDGGFILLGDSGRVLLAIKQVLQMVIVTVGL